jgi:hypothetical protein
MAGCGGGYEPDKHRPAENGFLSLPGIRLYAAKPIFSEGFFGASGGRETQRNQNLKMPTVQSGFGAHRKPESFTKS